MLTDIRMPLMDGIALALAAKRDYPDLTILLMTGFADQRERARGLDAIVTDVLTNRSRSPTCVRRCRGRWPPEPRDGIRRRVVSGQPVAGRHVRRARAGCPRMIRLTVLTPCC